MGKTDVQGFYFNLENNIFEIHERLKNWRWIPDPYTSFYVRDPKLRHIHKASVRDRVFNQALFRTLEPIFDKHFIFDSFSCRVGKGTHKGVIRLENFTKKITSNYTSHTFALKCDVKKFFDNISHKILINLVKEKIKEKKLLNLIEKIIFSFETEKGKGLPLGNVTSQLFANIYMNEFDQFVKHTLRIKYYLRYCDDFIILHKDREFLSNLIPIINNFLAINLNLYLHPNKVIVRKINNGIDFLGYVTLPHYRVLRTKTKRRMFNKIKNLKALKDKNLISQDLFERSINSYLGILTHCKGCKIKKIII